MVHMTQNKLATAKNFSPRRMGKTDSSDHSSDLQIPSPAHRTPGRLSRYGGTAGRRISLSNLAKSRAVHPKAGTAL